MSASIAKAILFSPAVSISGFSARVSYPFAGPHKSAVSLPLASLRVSPSRWGNSLLSDSSGNPLGSFNPQWKSYSGLELEIADRLSGRALSSAPKHPKKTAAPSLWLSLFANIALPIALLLSSSLWFGFSIASVEPSSRSAAAIAAKPDLSDPFPLLSEGSFPALEASPALSASSFEAALSDSEALALLSGPIADLSDPTPKAAPPEAQENPKRSAHPKPKRSSPKKTSVALSSASFETAAEPFSDPTPELSAEPAAEAPSDPAPEPSAEPAAEAPSDPAPEPSAEAPSDPNPAPFAEPASEDSSNPTPAPSDSSEDPMACAWGDGSFEDGCETSRTFDARLETASETPEDPMACAWGDASFEDGCESSSSSAAEASAFGDSGEERSDLDAKMLLAEHLIC